MFGADERQQLIFTGFLDCPKVRVAIRHDPGFSITLPFEGSSNCHFTVLSSFLWVANTFESLCLFVCVLR